MHFNSIQKYPRKKIEMLKLLMARMSRSTSCFLLFQEEKWHVRIYGNLWREVNSYKNDQGLCRNKNKLLIRRSLGKHCREGPFRVGPEYENMRSLQMLIIIVLTIKETHTYQVQQLQLLWGCESANSMFSQ